MADDNKDLQVTETGVPIPIPTEEEIAKALNQVAAGQVPDRKRPAVEPETEHEEPDSETRPS
jgi:hypothetical protein